MQTPMIRSDPMRPRDDRQLSSLFMIILRGWTLNRAAVGQLEEDSASLGRDARTSSSGLAPAKAKALDRAIFN